VQKFSKRMLDLARGLDVDNLHRTAAFVGTSLDLPTTEDVRNATLDPDYPTPIQLWESDVREPEVLPKTGAPAPKARRATDPEPANSKWLTAREYHQKYDVPLQTLANWRSKDRKAGRQEAKPGQPHYERFGEAIRYKPEPPPKKR
jgi:hypothetical protein